MTNIAGQISIRKVGSRRFELLDDINIILNDGFEVSILKGFTYDGGSLPRFMYTALDCPFGSRGDFGYLLHDFLYSRSRLGQSRVSRKYADKAMLEVMLFRGVSKLRAWTIYRAVRLFAFGRW